MTPTPKRNHSSPSLIYRSALYKVMISKQNSSSDPMEVYAYGKNITISGSTIKIEAGHRKAKSGGYFPQYFKETIKFPFLVGNLPFTLQICDKEKLEGEYWYRIDETELERIKAEYRKDAETAAEKEKREAKERSEKEIEQRQSEAACELEEKVVPPKCCVHFCKEPKTTDTNYCHIHELEACTPREKRKSLPLYREYDSGGWSKPITAPCKKDGCASAHIRGSLYCQIHSIEFDGVLTRMLKCMNSGCQNYADPTILYCPDHDIKLKNKGEDGIFKGIVKFIWSVLCHPIWSRSSKRD